MTPEFLLPWLIFLGISIAATLSPGPAFVITLNNAIKHGRAQGIITAIGLGLAVALHVSAVLTGLSLLMHQVPFLFLIIKYAGAAYLIYIGAKAMLSKQSKSDLINQNAQPKNPDRTLASFFTQGFLTNALNPKAWVYFSVVFAQFITPDMPLQIKALYGATSMIVEATIFSALSIVLTHAAIRARFMAISHWIERICGGLLIALGVKLAISKL